MIIAAIFGLFGLLIAVVVTPFVIRWSLKGAGLDAPDDYRKKHAHPIPRLGGIPMFLAFLCGMAALLFMIPTWAQKWLPVVVCASAIFGLGLWDDFKPLGAKLKLVGQLIVAFAAYSMGLSITQITYPMGTGYFTMPLGAWGLVFTVFWFVAVPNVINLIDGIDGLAAGVGVFLLCTLGYVGWSANQMDVAWMSFGMAGALLGFLCFNFPPARIFMGDGGAYLIGFVVAALSLTSANKGSIAAALLVTIVALGLPIMDTLFALIRRGLRGFPLFRADAEHIHHRLQRLGLSERRIVLGMYLVCVVFSLIGLSVFWSQGRTLPIALGVIFIIGVFAVRYLGYVWSWAHLTEQVQHSLGKRDDVKYILAQMKVLELEVVRCESFGEFEKLFRQAAGRIGFVFRDEFPEDEGSLKVIRLNFTGEETLVLKVRADNKSMGHWRRAAECLRQPYTLALKKWPVRQGS